MMANGLTKRTYCSGDLLRVRSADGIQSTFESHSIVDALLIMPEMREYAGRQGDDHRLCHRTVPVYWLRSVAGARYHMCHDRKHSAMKRAI